MSNLFLLQNRSASACLSTKTSNLQPLPVFLSAANLVEVFLAICTISSLHFCHIFNSSHFAYVVIFYFVIYSLTVWHMLLSIALRRHTLRLFRCALVCNVWQPWVNTGSACVLHSYTLLYPTVYVASHIMSIYLTTIPAVTHIYI